MTKQLSAVKGPVAIKNVAEFMAMTTRLIERDAHLPGISVCSGFSGFGKTWASIFAQNKTNAVRVEVGDSWTCRSVLVGVLRELSEPVKNRQSLSEMVDVAVGKLSDDPNRPLIVDEADKLVDKNMIEIVRELHERSGVPVILIGEERLPTKLLNFERVHNRVLHWMQAQPCDLEDARALADAYAPGVAIKDDLLEKLRAASDGRARRIVVNVHRVEDFARNVGKKSIDLDLWGRQQFHTGEPPQVRAADPYPKRSSSIRQVA